MIRIAVQKKLVMADGLKTLSVDTEIAFGEFVVLFGKSGSGKTSLLRIISGLLKPEEGKIACGDEIWLDTRNKINLPIQKRRIGFVFQDLALFPNMTIEENLLFAAGKERDDAYLCRLLRMTNMESFSQSKPQTLSGGQQQRVAIIRALARKPRLLLLDEPFSSLDPQMSDHLRKELKTIHREFNLTTLLVSHESTDIYGTADRAMEVKEAKILESGRPGMEPGNEHLAGEGSYKGRILQIYKSDLGYILEILSGDTVLRLPVDEESITVLKPGIMVLISSKNFHLHIQPLSCLQ